MSQTLFALSTGADTRSAAGAIIAAIDVVEAMVVVRSRKQLLLRLERHRDTDDATIAAASYLLFNVLVPLALVLTFPVHAADGRMLVMVRDKQPYAWVVICGEAFLWAATCCSAFFGVHRTDPGYLTKEIMQRIQPQESDSRQKRRRKLCRACGFAPPLRTHHCQACRRCVSTFDHHCEFIGTCIGERNRAQFYWFLVVNEMALLRGFTAICSMTAAITNNSAYSMSSTVVVRIAAAKTYLLLLLMGCSLLCFSQSFLALTNSTSFEWLYYRRLGYLLGNHPIRMPFYRSILQNLQAYGCFGVPTSQEWTPIVWDPPQSTPCNRRGDATNTPAS